MRRLVLVAFLCVLALEAEASVEAKDRTSGSDGTVRVKVGSTFLRIPRNYVVEERSGLLESLYGDVESLGLDDSEGSRLLFEIPAADLAAAIPGFDAEAEGTVIIGSIKELAENRDGWRGWARRIWSLSGDYGSCEPTFDESLNLYRLYTGEECDLFYVLLRMKPVPGKKMPEPAHAFFIASCSDFPSSERECSRTLIRDPIVIEYGLLEKNMVFFKQIDEFVKKRIVVEISE